MKFQECAGGCGGTVPYKGRTCPACTDRQIKARPVDEPRPEPEEEPVTGSKGPRGPAPNARRMLNGQIRMLEAVQKDISLDLYQFNRRGVREKSTSPERLKLAERLEELNDAIIAAAKEERQWRDAEWAASKKMTPAQVVAEARTYLVEKGSPEDKRRAIAELLESLGESPMRAVP